MQNGIIDITRNDQARDKFYIAWSERLSITQDTPSLLNMKDDEEEKTFIRFDSLSSRTRRVDDVKKLVTQLSRIDSH